LNHGYKQEKDCETNRKEVSEKSREEVSKKSREEVSQKASKECSEKDCTAWPIYASGSCR
jgi:hypothetical protein